MKATIFLDFDGTVVDVSQKQHKIYSDILKEAGYSPLSKDEYWIHKKSCMNIYDLIALTCPTEFTDLYLKKRSEMIETKSYLELDKLHTGIVQSLNTLKKHCLIYLLTARSNKENLEWQIDKLKIKDYFEKVLTVSPSDSVPEQKCSTIKSFTKSPKSIIIGDTESDIRAGKLAGITTIGILTGIRTKELILKEKPDHIIENFSDILNILDIS